MSKTSSGQQSPAPLEAIENRYPGPSEFIIGQFNAQASDILRIKARGFVNTIFYQRADFNGNSADWGAVWRATVKGAGLKMVLIPGHGAKGNDYTSTFLEDLEDPDVLWLTLEDEPETLDGPNGTPRLSVARAQEIIADWKSRAQKAGKVLKPITWNLTAYDKLFQQPIQPGLDSRSYLDLDEISVWSSDVYFIQNRIPRLFGRQEYEVAGGINPFTSTLEGHVARLFITGPLRSGGTWNGAGFNPSFTAPTQAAGKPYLTYVAGCRITENVYYYGYDENGQFVRISEKARSPLDWEVSTQCWSNVIFGGVGIILFNSLVEGGFRTDYQEVDDSLVPFFQEFKRRIQILQSAGVLMKSEGGREEWTTRTSATAITGYHHTSFGTGTGWDPPLGTQLQGGFEGVELRGTNGRIIRIIQNIAAESLVLTDAAWGVTGMVFTKGEVKAFEVRGGGLDPANLFGDYLLGFYQPTITQIISLRGAATIGDTDFSIVSAGRASWMLGTPPPENSFLFEIEVSNDWILNGAIVGVATQAWWDAGPDVLETTPGYGAWHVGDSIGFGEVSGSKAVMVRSGPATVPRKKDVLGFLYNFPARKLRIYRNGVEIGTITFATSDRLAPIVGCPPLSGTLSGFFRSSKSRFAVNYRLPQ